MEVSAKSTKILPLTSMRFFAAFYVVVYHESDNVSWLRGGANMFSRFCQLGYVSVSLFFFLSGFVLAIAYLGKDAVSARPSISLRNFFVARFARIYPLLFACLLLDLPHFFYTARGTPRVHFEPLFKLLVVSFGAMEAWFPNLMTLDSPSWSIAAEFFFYLLFPLLGSALWKLRAPAMALTAACLYIGGTVFVVYLHALGVDRYASDYNPVTHLYGFLLGICLAKFYLFTNQHDRWHRRILQLSPVMLLASILTYLAIPVFAIPVPETLLQHGILIPLYAVAMLALCSGHRIIERLLARHSLVILGEASFALYLIHMPLAHILRRPMERYGAIGILAYLALAVGLSVLSFYRFETPSRRWIMNRFHARSRENAVVQAAGQ